MSASVPRHRELEERLKALEFRRTDLSRQKDSLDQVRARLPKVLRSELPAEELRLLYELSQEEIRELKTALLLSDKSSSELTRSQQALQEKNQRLDLLCRKLNSSLAEKDSLIARYLAEMVDLRTRFEELSNKAEIQKFLEAFDASIDSIQLDESQWSLPQERPIEQEDKSIRIAELEADLAARSQDADIRRLERQLAETQELYALVCAQLKEKEETLSTQSTELHTMRLQLQEAQSQHSVLSARLLKHSSEREYQTKAEQLQIDALQRKQTEHEEELSQAEARYQSCLEDLQRSLQAARDKLLQLHEDKARLEKDLSARVLEAKELGSALQVKEIKLCEATARLQEQARDIVAQQRDIERVRKALSEAEASKRQAVADSSQAKERVSALEKQLEALDEHYRQQAPAPPLSSEEAASKAIQKLSLLILSKDRGLDAETLAVLRTALGEDFSRLMEGHEAVVERLEAAVSEEREKARSKIVREVELLLRTQDNCELLLLLADLLQQQNHQQANELLQSCVSDVASTLENACIESVALQQEYESARPSLDDRPEVSVQRNLAQENSVLLSLVNRLRRAPSSGVNLEDAVPLLQCSASALEDLLCS